MEQKQPKRGKALDIFRSKYARKFVSKYKWSYLIGIIVLIIIDVLQTEVPLVVGDTIDQHGEYKDRANLELSGQQMTVFSYVLDVLMGVAAGGLSGMLVGSMQGK